MFHVSYHYISALDKTLLSENKNEIKNVRTIDKAFEQYASAVLFVCYSDSAESSIVLPG